MINEFKIKPIGFIKAKQGNFYLEIKKECIPGLKGLDGFSHIQVFWWCHLSDNKKGRNVLECKKPYRKSPDILGVFSTRSQSRPNPIALTTVPVLNIDYDKGVIYACFIDAEDETPIIDIKPYLPAMDKINNVKVPEWCSHWPNYAEESASFDWVSEFVSSVG